MQRGWSERLRSFRLHYVPVVMVYFAYGALGLIDVTRDLWIKESLSFTPSQLAGIAVWLFFFPQVGGEAVSKMFPGQLAGLIAGFVGMVVGSLMPQVLRNRHEPRKPMAGMA